MMRWTLLKFTALTVTPADIQAARKRLGLTQHGLAGALHMGKWGWQTISAWEGGRKPIPADLYLKIAGLEALHGEGANG